LNVVCERILEELTGEKLTTPNPSLPKVGASMRKQEGEQKNGRQ
jgi:hypothetical protein